MKFKFSYLIALFVCLGLSTSLFANNAQSLYKKRCVACHTTQTVVDKSKLLGPPADEIMVHVKEAYPNKDKAIAFMVEYILNPNVNKALCASMDKFGLMPSMKGMVSQQEAKKIATLMYDKFPRSDFQEKDQASRANVTFEMIDTDGDGFISPKEFRDFRAKRNGISPESFKQDLYFQKVDLNRDGKLDKDEFKKMKSSKSGD